MGQVKSQLNNLVKKSHHKFEILSQRTGKLATYLSFSAAEIVSTGHMLVVVGLRIAMGKHTAYTGTCEDWCLGK